MHSVLFRPTSSPSSVAVVEEEALLRVQGGNGRHVSGIQLEVEDVEFLTTVFPD